jgi:uncharacterized protein with ParB-like and HNH nuclease domain
LKKPLDKAKEILICYYDKKEVIMADLIYSIHDIFTEYLNGEYKYNIPAYQRGYKWDKQQVEQLLNDIDQFKASQDRFYCLQNITIVENATEKCFNVVDGQQRLTTILVLLSFLGQSAIIDSKLKYSVRPDTDNFIKLYIIGNKISEKDWKLFLESSGKDPNIQDYDHQDIYYLFSAYNNIKNWFEEKKTDKEYFLNKLLNSVKLIVNKPNTENEQELFTNLNSGKVSLDGADLVRALLITHVAKEELGECNIEDIKNIVRLNERRVRIGLELDEISAWWNQPNVKSYFDWLNKIKESSKESIKFNSEVYPIDLLYKLYSAKEGKDEITLGDFGDQNYIKLYREIIILHRTIKDWYQDCEIYHFVKFIMTYTKITFSTVWLLWKKKDNSRKTFIAEIKGKVKATLNTDNIDKIDDLKENWVENGDL